jgi:hypothetical protein
VKYLHGIPAAGNDVLLTTAGAVTGLVLGCLCAAFASVYAGPDGTPTAKAGALAAVLWILVTGSRIAFELYALHGGGKAIARFSAAHQITSMQAWAAALILMALAEVVGRNGVLALRGPLSSPLTLR